MSEENKKSNGKLIASLTVGLVVIGMIIAGLVSAYLAGQLDTERKRISINTTIHQQGENCATDTV